MDPLARELAELRDAVRGATRAAQAGRELLDTVNETIRVLQDAARSATDDALRLHVNYQLDELRHAASQAVLTEFSAPLPAVPPAP
eukprot:14932046-Alexandrium_andersonii.AAC.1